MSIPALRRWGPRALPVLLAAAIALAGAATMAGATTTTRTTHKSRTTLKAPTSRRSAGRTAHRRRGRRLPPDGVYSRNAILVDPATGEVLFAKNATSPVPIASLTKLMTALVFLEQKPDLDRIVEVTRAEIDGAGHTQLRNHENVTMRDLLHMSLMCSDNVATRVLARESGISGDEFLARMNRKAFELGLSTTRFTEFTGLDENNIASAADVARLLHAAAHDELIQQITTTRSYEFRSATRWHAVHNTDRLLYGRYEVLGGKTGFILEAGYCFATWVRAEGRDLIAVVLGAPTKATRFADAVRMLQKSATPPPATISRS